MNSDDKRRAPLTPLIACALIALPILYVLSYAPVVRVSEGPDPGDSVEFLTSPPDQYALYTPVNWLIDHTPLRKPLLSWAELWSVRGRFEVAKWWFRDN